MDDQNKRERIVVSEETVKDSNGQDIYGLMANLFAETPNADEISYDN